MTRKEASKVIKDGLDDMTLDYFDDEQYEALTMAIQALSQEPCDVFDEYGNYKYPSDVELTEPNTATSMPCEDAISRQAVLMEIDKYLCGVPFDEKGIDEVIKDLPPVKQEPSEIIYGSTYGGVSWGGTYNPQERKGHWDSRTCKCSECGYQIAFSEYAERKYKFCPDCGADMRGADS